MDFDYAIYFDLYASYTKKHVRIILKKAKQLGLINWENHLENTTIEKITEIIYVPKSNGRSNRNRSISVKLEGANWSFIAHCSDTNQLSILFSSFYKPWKKKFEIEKPEFGPPVDAARHIRLFLNLLKDFEIKGINAYIWNC